MGSDGGWRMADGGWQRTFFTEGAGIFDFGRQRQTQLFYRRRIGLDTSGAAVPLLAGARLIGRIGSEQVGLLAVRTRGAQPATGGSGSAERSRCTKGS